LELAQKLMGSDTEEPTQTPVISDEKESGKPLALQTDTTATDAVSSESQKTDPNPNTNSKQALRVLLILRHQQPLQLLAIPLG
jgi:hypothetical protein